MNPGFSDLLISSRKKTLDTKKLKPYNDKACF